MKKKPPHVLPSQLATRLFPPGRKLRSRLLLPVASMYSMHLSIKMGMGFSGVTTLVKGTPK